jgi:arylsulfatase A-like enzyme
VGNGFMTRKRADTGMQGRVSVRAVITIGVVLGLSAGFVDVTSSSQPSSFALILAPLAATVCFVSLTYVTAWFLVAVPLSRLFAIGSLHLAISVAVFWAMCITLYAFTRVVLYPSDAIRLFIVLSVSTLVSIGAYFTAKALDDAPKRRDGVAMLTLALPFVAAETMLAVWLHDERFGPFFSIQSSLLNLGFLLVVITTILLVFKIGRPFAMMRGLSVFMALVVLSPCLILLPGRSSPHPRSANRKVKHVILISVDTLRPDALSCYDSSGVSTPHIDRLADDGIVFTQAMSSGPWTLPSLSSIMTGLPPTVHLSERRESRLPDGLSTLAERMRDAGYLTKAIGSNPFLNPSRKLSQGFFEYDFFPKSSPARASFGSELVRALLPSQFQSDASTRDLTNLAIKWIESKHKENFFLWLHYFDPHVPYSPPPQFLPKTTPATVFGKSFDQVEAVRGGWLAPTITEKAWIEVLYNGEVRYVDQNIGALIDALKRLRIYDESLVIFTSDHGEEFWEHDGFEHGHTLYNELLRVPLIIKVPRYVSDLEISRFVPTRSIMPTILDLCDIDHENEPLLARSLSPIWRGDGARVVDQQIISRGLLYFEDRVSIIFRDLKYIRFLETNREELYDLTEDPGETSNIAPLFPKVVQEARALLAEHDASAEKLRDRLRISDREELRLDDETIRQLRALGYL